MRKRGNKTRLYLAAAILLGFLGVLGKSTARAEDFSVPQKITDGARKYQIARLSNGIAAFDTSGTLHATYWSGEESLPTSPDNPAYVYYRAWSSETGWSAQTGIDDSFNGDGHIGGRHPALAVAPNGTVWVAWHDHRDCTPGNWMDNTEIYADFKPRGGAFTSSDIRLTNTPPTPGFRGDNGFCPKPVAGSDGRARVVWYDFHFSAGGDTFLNVSDIFLKTSDTAGVFNPAETMADMRLTDFADRGGLEPSTPPYTMPDAALDTSGTLHLIWVAGTGDASPLYYAPIPESGAAPAEIVLASNVRAYYDPPHIAAAVNGDVWIAYAEATGYEKVRIRRRVAGANDFETAVTIADNPAVRQYQPDLEADAAGNAHVVWVRRRSTSDRDVVYAVYDPAAGEVGEEIVLSPYAGKWDRPTLALRADGAVAVFFEENVSFYEGDLWFTALEPEDRTAAARGEIWGLYP